MAKGISSLLAVLQRHALPALLTFASVHGAALVYLAFTPSQYEATARLILDDKRVSVSELGRDLTQTPSVMPGGPSPIANQAEVAKSEAVLAKALAEVFSETEENSSAQSKLTTKQLRRRLKVKIVPATNILEMNYRNRDPELAAKILNAVSAAMVQESADVIRKEAASARTFLEAEVPKQRQRLEIAEANENRYRKRSGVVALTDQTRSLVQSVDNLENQERTVFAQLQEARSRDASLRQITDEKTISNAYASVRRGQNEELKKLRAKLADLEEKAVEARLRFTDNHPTVIKLTQERDSLRALYTQKLGVSPSEQQSNVTENVASEELSQNLTSQLVINEIERLALENKLKAIQATQANLKARLAELPMKQQPLTALTRKREEAADALKLVQSKLEEARIAEAQLVGNLRVIDLAQVPTLPESPKLLVVLVLATVFGIILAIGIVLLLEMMDNTVRDASEAEDMVDLPMLGVLPNLPAKDLNLAAAEEFLDDVGLVEPYRMLLKTLEFRGADELRSIVVSSTLSGEGKSVVVSHLAAVAAMLSRRTLLIDADLRRPVQHNLFHLPQNPGITDVIEGHTSLLDAVQSTDIENLSVLTCGETGGRPSHILESAEMKSLIAEASQHYDLVIIDTPPLSACADAATLARYGDGLMLIIRPNVTVKEMLPRVMSELKLNGITTLGVVVNGMTTQTEKYYRYPVENYKPLLQSPKQRYSNSLSFLGVNQKNSPRDSRSK